MRHLNNAILKGPGAQKRHLALFQIERGVFHWRTLAGEPYRGVEADFLDAPDAIKALRVLVEADPDYVGWDLTITTVAPPAEERAAKRIMEHFGTEYMLAVSAGSTLDEIAEIIRTETAIDKLLDAVDSLVTYRFRTLRQPKPAGLDMTEGGLLLDVIAAIERARACDLGNLKAALSEKPSAIQVFGSLPQGRKR